MKYNSKIITWNRELKIVMMFFLPTCQSSTYASISNIKLVIEDVDGIIVD